MFHSPLKERDFKEQGTVVKLNFKDLERNVKRNASKGCICVWVKIIRKKKKPSLIINWQDRNQEESIDID